MKEIPLTQGKVTLVDDEDFDYLNQWKWTTLKNKHTFYAYRKIKRKTIRMHRLILGLTDSKILSDHKDHNGLNNQRHNLRAATYSENNCNGSSRRGSSSKYKGVLWDNTNKKWVARAQKNGISKHLGRFKTEEEAALAYNNKAIEWHGEFANLNKIAS